MKAFAVAACFALSLAAALSVPIAGAQTAGIQYDEISRVIMPGATPPPPGAFATDVAAMQNGVLTRNAPRRSSTKRQLRSPSPEQPDRATTARCN